MRLRAAGHRRVAFFGDLATSWTAREGPSGFLDVFPDTATTLTRRGLNSVEAAEQAARDALALTEPPTAFVSGRQPITIESAAPCRTPGSKTRSRWSASAISR